LVSFLFWVISDARFGKQDFSVKSMPRYYVDLTEVPPTLLGLIGYILVAENKKFELYLHKGELSVVNKFPPRFMYVDDVKTQYRWRLLETGIQGAINFTRLSELT
jgi:hypothetical protein